MVDAAAAARMRGQTIRQQAVQNALQLGLLATGVGAAARGGTGLIQLLRRSFRPSSSAPSTGSLVLPVKLPRKDDEEEQFKTAGWFSDMAGAARDTAADIATAIVPSRKSLANIASGAGNAVSGVLTGANNTDPAFWWASTPLNFGAGAAGLYGGWSLADKLLDRRRKKELESEVERAKKEYEAALSGRSKLGQALDELYDGLEKEGNASDVAGGVLGAGALLALATGLGSGYLGYNLTRKLDPVRLKRKAKKTYMMRQQLQRPAPILAVPEQASDELEDE